MFVPISPVAVTTKCTCAEVILGMQATVQLTTAPFSVPPSSAEAKVALVGTTSVITTLVKDSSVVFITVIS